MKMKAAMFTVLLFSLVSTVTANADTQVINARTGKHDNFTRIVLDSKGDHPLSIINDSGSIDIRYEDLNLTESEEDRLNQELGGVSSLTVTRANEVIQLKLFQNANDVRIKTSYLPSKAETDNGYRLVIDIYPQPASGDAEVKSTPVTAVAENTDNQHISDEVKEEIIPITPVPLEKAAPGEAVTILSNAGVVKTDSEISSSQPNNEDLKKEPSAEPAPAEKNDTLKVSEEKEREVSESSVKPGADISGKVEIILRNTGDERESSKFAEYSDRGKAVTGNIEINRIEENKSEIQLKMKNVAQEDQNITLKGEIYGSVKAKAEYDELPHRYQYGARNLY